MDAAVDAVEIPRTPVPDIIVELQRLILRQHADRVDAGIDAVAQRKVDDSILASVGDGGLGDMLRQRIQPGALAARKQHCYTLFHFALSFLETVCFADDFFFAVAASAFCTVLDVYKRQVFPGETLRTAPWA